MSDSTVDVLFKTRAELAGARAFADSIERQIGAAKAAGKDFAQLEEQLKKVNKALESAPKTPGPEFGEMFSKVREGLGDIIPGFAKLDGIASKFAGGALGAVAGGFAAMAAGAEVAKHALDEFANAEEGVAKLDAALAQAGQLNDAYRESLQQLAHEMQETTRVADEQWIAVLTRLTQFGAKPENISEYADAVKNLAGLMGGDVASAATVFARAMQGSFEMLSRYGIHIEESGTQTERLRRLMEELALRGGGQLEASGRSLNGQFRAFTQTTADLSKGLGRIIADTGVVQWALGLVTDGFAYWAEKIDGAIGKVDGLENAVRPTVETLNEAATSSKAFAEALKQEGEATKGAADALNTYLEKLKGIQRLKDQLESAEMAGELAAVDESGATGSDAETKKAAIRKKYAAQKFERQQAATKQEIQLREGAYQKAAGEALEIDQSIADKKDQLGYQQTIESTEFAVKGRMHTTAEAKKEWETALMRAAQEHAKQPKAAREVAQQLGIPDEFGEEEERTRRAYEDAQSQEQKSREKLRALKGAPGLSGKSAAEMQGELARLQKQREQADANLKDADAARQGNPALRDQLQYNERIYGAQSRADESEANARIRRERQQEQERREREQQQRLRDKVEGRETSGGGDVGEVQEALKDVIKTQSSLGETIVKGLGALAEGHENTKASIDDLMTDLKQLRYYAENGGGWGKW